MNGINPIIALILTCLVGYLTFVLFSGGHVVWGIIFAIIFVDFLADVFLSFKKDK